MPWKFEFALEFEIDSSDPGVVKSFCIFLASLLMQELLHFPGIIDDAFAPEDVVMHVASIFGLSPGI